MSKGHISDNQRYSAAAETPLRFSPMKGAENWPLEFAPREREWMDEVTGVSPYGDEGLVQANQTGWVIRCPATFTARWDGDRAASSLRLRFARASRHFKGAIRSDPGSGLIAFDLPYVAEGSDAVGLMIGCVPNEAKMNVYVVEHVMSFEKSEEMRKIPLYWKVYRPWHKVKFRRGEAICFLQPVNVDFVEGLKPMIESQKADSTGSPEPCHCSQPAS